MKFGKKAKQIVEIYNNKFPHLVVGFSEKIEQMFNEDFDGFLESKI